MSDLTRARLLAALALLFAARVAGQALALTLAPPWLPAFDRWHSGLLPYPLLLSSQLAILAVQFHLLTRLARGRLPHLSPPARRLVLVAAALYAAVMLLRLPLSTLAGHAWHTSAIPVTFHLVLALWLALFASRRPPSIPPHPQP